MLLKILMTERLVVPRNSFQLETYHSQHYPSSRMGPSLFVIYIKGHKSLSASNTTVISADNTILIALYLKIQMLALNVMDSSEANKLTFNTIKTKEIVFHLS